MSIYVFISHSTWPKADLDQRLQGQVPIHAAFRERLCERLKQEPWIEVIVDEDIPPARFWHEVLFDWIADCCAAIVLVNEQALHHSPWVDTEVKVLGYRAHNEKEDFRLIIVPFGGITESHIAKHSAWEPVAISKLQMLPRHGLDEANVAAVDHVIQEIVGILKQLPESVEDKTQSGWLVDRLCALLEMDTRHLKEIGKSLGTDTKGISNVSVLRRRVAHTLYREGPKALRKLLKYPKCNLDASNLRDILEILNTHWIDMSASIGILSCCPKTTTRRVIAINGKEVAYTPKAYVRQVCGEQYSWPVITVKPTYDVIGQIRETLVKNYFGEELSTMLPNPKHASEEEITKCLNYLLELEDSVPVFVALLQEGGGVIDDLIAEISAVFPIIRIIVCTGTEQGRAILPPDIPMLMPEFSLADEARAFKDFCGIGTHIRKGK